MVKNKHYIAFFALNALWLLVFSLFSLSSTWGNSPLFAVSSVLMHFLFMLLYAAFGAQSESKSELQKHFFVAAIIVIGLILRVALRYVFLTEPQSDFRRAHDVYLFLMEYGPLLPVDSWADFNCYQLYYSRFPGWFPFFVVTRVVYALFGVGMHWMILLNYVLYVLSAALLYAAVKKLFSYAVAFCATAIFVFNPNLVVWTTFPSPDHFFIFLFCGMLFFLAKAYENREQYRYLCVAAVFAALTDLFKPIGIMFLIAYFCVEIFMAVSDFVQTVKNNYRKWAMFLFTFLLVYLAGYAAVRAEIRRVFHIETVSSAGIYWAWAWSTDDAGRYTHAVVMDKFFALMDEHDNNQVVVMEEMSVYAREVFSEARPYLLSILLQKTRIVFADEGVLGWVMHSPCPVHSESLQRVLGRVLWVYFTAHIFVVMFLSGFGALVMLFEKKHRKFLIFLLTTVIGYTLILLLGIVQGRYRLLLYPMLSVLTAYGISAFARKGELFNVLKFHGRKLVLPVDKMKDEMKKIIEQRGLTRTVDFGAGTLFWSKYFAEDLGLTVVAVDTAYAEKMPENNNPGITFFSDISEVNAEEAKVAGGIFICDAIHHFTPEFWQKMLPEIAKNYDTIIIKDIDANHKFGNFMNKLHDRVVNGEKIENVYPSEIEKNLTVAGFEVKTTAMRKLWYPHFLLSASRQENEQCKLNY